MSSFHVQRYEIRYQPPNDLSEILADGELILLNKNLLEGIEVVLLVEYQHGRITDDNAEIA